MPRFNPLWLVFFLLFWGYPVFAAEHAEQTPAMVPMIDENGKIMMVEKPPVPLRSLNAEETQALDHPGQKVPINLSPCVAKRIDFWHLVSRQKYDAAMVY